MKSKSSFKADGAMWKGSVYRRGGILHDKHGNTYKVPITYRDNKAGLVSNPKGNILGIEKNRDHYYASDPTKIRKLTTYQSKRKKAIMASLRKKGKIR